MRNSDQPSVHINYFQSDSSYYSFDENEIVLIYSDNMNASLYHEYRHYLQYKYAPNIMKIHTFCNKWFELFVMFGFLFIGSKFELISPIITLLLGIPIQIIEADANIFAWKRLNKKGFKDQVNALYDAQMSYFFLLVILPVIIILKSIYLK